MTHPVTVSPATPQRVLLIKPSALGDVVTALPVLRGLKRSFPGVHVTWLLRDLYTPLLAHDPDVDEILTYDRKLLGRFWRSRAGYAHVKDLRRRLREGQFDWAIDLQGLARSGYFAKWSHATVRAGFADARELAPRHYTHRVRCAATHTVGRNIELARRLGVDARDEDLSLSISPAGRLFADTMMEELGLAERDFFVLVPPTRWTTKWYPVRRWREVAGNLAAQKPVILLGTAADIPACDEIAGGCEEVVNLAGRTSIDEMVALIARAAAVGCSDSASKFIAQAVGVPPVVLIGPTKVERTGPYPAADVPGAAVLAPVPCRGCLRKHCRHVTCMELIRPGDVVEAILEVGLSAPCPDDSPGES